MNSMLINSEEQIIVVPCLKVLSWSIHVADDVTNITNHGGKYKNPYYEGHTRENVLL